MVMTVDGPDAINFSLAHLPASMFMNLAITVTLPDGRQIDRWKLFQRAPPPPATSNVSVFQVDHETQGMLMNGWLPFVGVGWFNSPFEYSHESVGDMSLVKAGVSPFLARGGSLATEWGKKGHTLIRLGSDHWLNASMPPSNPWNYAVCVHSFCFMGSFPFPGVFVHINVV